MWKLLFGIILVVFQTISVHCYTKRSIDLIAAHSIISNYRLPREVVPNSYTLKLHPYPEHGNFSGDVTINATVQFNTRRVILHKHPDLKINFLRVTSIKDDKASSRKPGNVQVLDAKWEQEKKETFITIDTGTELESGVRLDIYIEFQGTMFNDTSEGLFRSSYVDPETKKRKWFVATFMRPNLARNVFPCFDEPSFKAIFNFTVVRPKHMRAVFNMPLEATKNLDDYWAMDHFQPTPPMATFSFAVVISELTYIRHNDSEDIKMKVWARPDFIEALLNVTEKVSKSVKFLEGFWGNPYPLPELNIFALPNYQATKPADGWGVLMFKESELSSRGSWHLTQELVYQWLGALATPAWFNEAHVNYALVRYITAYTTIKIGENETFNNWPTTMLYSIYYEFSKRYPHGKNTAIKQDSSSAKTELVLRMLNYTLGESTFRHGMQRFLAECQYKTFHDIEIWKALTEQARFDNTLPKSITIDEIMFSWITKDRLPVVTVTRDYQKNAAEITQRVYLRERPHDLPDQEKFLWWIPIVLIRQDKMNFMNTTPTIWMKTERTVRLENMPGKDKFVIVNPEEIGPFPVNYDTENWNMLARYLQTENRTKIPVYTRAKLLHDAWNLAYAGDLSFATALNMTLFLRNERHYLAWDPVFTLIDHIGKHIDSSAVHKKFQTYVRLLLTPLYEELGNEPQEGEQEGRAHLRSSSKVFLCQAGYRPCIEEAQKAFKKWMESPNPDEGNPVANQYICPVFKWGTKEEWEFGLQRIINFPSGRKPNERTYLLKTLAGCPNDSWKIERLLNITVLEENGNFTDNDIYLIFSMLTGGANGYTTLFNFLRKNWDTIKIRFEEKPMLWNSIITSATSVFKTQEGLDMVSELYLERQTEFGNADFVIEKALKNIKEETKWSNENLPVIERWLDEYLRNNRVKIDE